MATRPYASRGGNETRSLGGVSPEAFGAGVGRAVGNVVEEIDRKKKLHEGTQAAVAFAEFRTATDDAVRAARESGDRYATDHVQTVKTDFDTRRDAFLGGIKNRELRDRYTAQMSNYWADVSGREDGYAASTRDAAFVGDANELVSLHANRARGLDAAGWKSEVEAYQSWVKNAPLPLPVKIALDKEGVQRIDRSYIEGLTERNPKAAQELLKTGAFSHLKPEVIDTLTGEVNIKIRAQEASTEAAGRAAKADAREKINLFKQQVAAGMTFPQQAFADMKALADQNGLEGESFAIATASVGNAYNQVTPSWTPAQWDAEASRLRAKVGKDPTKAEAADVAALNWVESHAPARIKEAQDDPLTWYIRQGHAVPPADYSYPAGLDGRKAAVRSAARQLGVRPRTYLQPNEAAELTEELKGQRASRADAIAKIAAWGDAAGDVARQVAPGDAAVLHMTGLIPYTRNLILEGQDARKGNPALSPDAKAQAQFAKLIPAGRLGSVVPSSARAGVIESATSIAAAIAARAGKAEAGDAEWKAAYHLALGGESGGRGGMGTWNNKPVLLPTGVTQAQFDAGLSRLQSNYPRGRAPVWREGGVVDMTVIRKQFTPVAEANGIYRFVNAAGQTLMAQDGNPFRLNLYQAIFRK